MIFRQMISEPNDKTVILKKMRTIIERFINVLCCDNRITNGIFSVDDEFHMDILEEYLVKYGIPAEEARITRNKVLEGRFPERQAYNKNGILVTFPTPEYKQRAIQRGTHFEQNPAKFQPNIFAQQPAAPQPVTPQPAASPASAESKPQSPEPAAPAVDSQKREQPSQLTPATSEPTAPSPAPEQTPAEPVAIPTVEQPPVEPVSVSQPPAVSKEPAPPTVPAKEKKTPEQKKAEEEYVEKLLTTENKKR